MRMPAHTCTRSLHGINAGAAPFRPDMPADSSGAAAAVQAHAQATVAASEQGPHWATHAHPHPHPHACRGPHWEPELDDEAKEYLYERPHERLAPPAAPAATAMPLTNQIVSSARHFPTLPAGGGRAEAATTYDDRLAALKAFNEIRRVERQEAVMAAREQEAAAAAAREARIGKMRHAEAQRKAVTVHMAGRSGRKVGAASKPLGRGSEEIVTSLTQLCGLDPSACRIALEASTPDPHSDPNPN